jgi:hypothetical protein
MTTTAQTDACEALRIGRRQQRHVDIAKRALAGIDEVAEHQDELIAFGRSPAQMQDRLLRLAIAEALVDIAESLRRAP